MARLWLLALVAAAAVATAHAATADETEEVFAGQRNCAMTGRLPEEPRSLSFCFKYNEESCCTPGHDAENVELFSTLTDVGLACRLRGDIREHPIAELYCLNCDPNQPRYIRNVGYSNAVDGSATDGRDQTLLICQDWAEERIGDATQFDECGFLKSSFCLDGAGVQIPDRDPYVCGDDIIIPTRDFYDGSASLTENIEAFLNADEFGTPNMAGDFGYKVVANRACTTAEVDASAPDFNPNCLMTLAQLNRVDVIAAFREAGFTGSFNADELCFGSASTAVASALVAVVLLALVVVLL
jgi:hypothetical protein